MIISNRSDCQRVSAYRIFLATEIMNNGWLFCWGNTRQPHVPQEIISILFVQTSQYADSTLSGSFSKSRFFGHRYIPLKFSDIYINHVQEEFTSASQIKQFLVAKPPEILPVCAPVFPAQPERPRTEFGGNETSCYQSPKQPKMTCVPSANLIYNIIYIYILIH